MQACDAGKVLLCAALPTAWFIFYSSPMASIFVWKRAFTIVTQGWLHKPRHLHCTQHKASVPMEDPIMIYEVTAAVAAGLNGPCERVLPSGTGAASS